MNATPTLLLMAGLPGAGKSTLAGSLGRALGWPVLDKDTVKTTLLQLGAEESLAGQASYEVLFDLARDLVVTQRLSIILDWPTFYPRVIEVCGAIAADADGALRVVFCAADRETRDRRTRDRVSRISQFGHAGRPTTTRPDSDGDGRELFPFLPAETLTVITEGPVGALVEALLSKLKISVNRAG
ncbi:AAA family ATPase [Microlunatus speluncae]|uniref:AAA family ATPase n=1 Tax=Microlunatus speluncae TaxID=2594267 RepID=UPI0012663ED9|nr:AAA family ATPase [Microlunatus speluncae]